MSLSDNLGRDDSDPAFRDNGNKAKAVGKSMAAAPSRALTVAVNDGELVSRDPEILNPEEKVKRDTGYTPTEILQFLREAEGQSKGFMDRFRRSWERSIKASRNEHYAGSKYLTTRWKQRSSLFKPKTRSAMRKNMAAAAQALFSSPNVVTVSANDDSNPRQRASAAVKQAILDYRLARSNGRASIPWFAIASTAKQDADVTGICCSKQYWNYQERKLRPDEKPISMANIDVDQMTGVRYEIVRDKPEIVPIPPENVLFDPNCSPLDVAGSSSYLIIRYPMQIHEIRRMMRARPDAMSPSWLEVSEDDLRKMSSMAPDDSTGVKRARDGGADAEAKSRGGRFRVVWVYECFMRLDDGEDWCFWTLGNQRMLSLPKATREVYPHLFGDRPYIIGMGAIDAHRPIPMSPVESWQPLQQEANDLANMRLDQLKQVVNPVAVVQRGRSVDMDAVQSRSQDRVMYVTDKDDVTWERPPDVPASAYQESNIVNMDFDDLSGSFNGSSVGANRQLNETVGGMRMLSGAASAVTEFDLRVWIETWAERVLSQVVRLEEFYENDRKLLEIAGAKAQLVERFGIDEITDHMLMEDSTVSVAAGLGAGDPMQKMAKLGGAAEMAGNILMPFIQAGMCPPIAPRPQEIIDEIFGGAGYKDAFARFFQGGDGPPPAMAPPQEQAPPPPTPADQIKAEGQKIQAQVKMAEVQTKAQVAQMQLQDRAEERRSKTLLERMKLLAADRKQHVDHAHQVGIEKDWQEHELEKQTLDAARNIAQEGRGHQRSEASTERGHERQERSSATAHERAMQLERLRANAKS